MFENFDISQLCVFLLKSLFTGNAVGKSEAKKSRFYKIGRSNQKLFLTKDVQNDEITWAYFMTLWP